MLCRLSLYALFIRRYSKWETLKGFTVPTCGTGVPQGPPLLSLVRDAAARYLNP